MRSVVAFIVICLLTFQCIAQEEKKMWVNFGMEWGIIMLPHIKGPDLYPANDFSRSGNIQLTLNRRLTDRSVLYTGLNWQITGLKLDAVFTPENHIQIAPDTIKYAALNQEALNVPVGYRYRFGQRSFLQLETQVGYTFSTRYQARINRADKELKMNEVSPVAWWAGAAIGGYSRVNNIDRFMYKVGLSYRLNGYFTNEGATKLHPLFLSFGFAF